MRFSREELRRGYSKRRHGTSLFRMLRVVSSEAIEEAISGEQKVRRKISNSTSSSGSSPSLTRCLLEKMFVRSPDDGLTEALIQDLECVGIHVIGPCKNFGVRICILGGAEKTTDIRIDNSALEVPPDGKSSQNLHDSSRGFYSPTWRLIVVHEKGVQSGTPIHELAHAWDHMYSLTHNRMQSLSIQLWYEFWGSRKRFVSAYASTNPDEYFAESFAAFFSENKRPKLQEDDPEMFEFLSLMLTCLLSSSPDNVPDDR